jgi:uncharacterized protein (DUF169 family)
MQSQLQQAIGIRYEPVAVLFSDHKPDKAKQFAEGKWGCVMFMLVAAARGAVAVFDRRTFGCQGGGVGLGFGNQYQNFPGGQECFCHFLSTGNDQWEQGRQVAGKVKPFLRPEAFDHFTQGERYIKSPELVQAFINNLPIMDIPAEYVVFKPLKMVAPDREKVEVVIFLGDMDQIAALTILANYHRPGNDNVIFPYAAGCQSIGIYAFKEAQAETPRAVLGLNDLSARLSVKKLLKDDVMSFAVPYAIFTEMEANVAGSFLERPTWKHLREN